MMKRAQIYLQESEYEDLRAEAFRRRASISAIIRRALTQTHILKEPRKRSWEGLDALVGMIHDKPDVSVRHDDYLWGDAE